MAGNTFFTHMKRIAVCQLADLPLGAAKRVVADGRELCLFHLSDGIFATDNQCTHQRASLAAGHVLDDAVIECPRHGSRFDIRTGAGKSLPALTPLGTYRIDVVNGTIYLHLDAAS